MTFAAQAQEVELIQSLKEVIMKGSIDGDNVVMVYGLADSWDDMKHLSKNSLDKDDFINLGELINTKGNSYGDSSYVDDLADSAQRGFDWSKTSAKFTKKSFKKMFTRPWKSLKKIPRSYKVNFENAKEAYYDSNNVLAGTVKYAGWAVYAQIEGMYYLVVEAPAMVAYSAIQTAIGAVGTVLSIPASILLQTARIAGQATWIAVKFVAMNVASLAAGTYSVLSTGVATAITVLAAGGIALYKGAKFVVSSPSKLFRPVEKIIETNMAYDEQENFAKNILAQLQSANTGFTLKHHVINKFNSKFVLLKEAKKAVILKVKVVSKKLVIQAQATTKYLRMVKKANDVRRIEAKKLVSQQLDNLLSATAL
jgi:hypothetical protein